MPTYLPKKIVHMTDDELVRLTTRGDDRAFAELMRRYLIPVHKIVKVHCAPRKVRATTQEVFYTFWKNIHRFKDGQDFRPWLLALAKRSSLKPQSILRATKKSSGTYLFLSVFTFTEIADRIQVPLNRLNEWAEQFRSVTRPILVGFVSPRLLVYNK